jgi:hypothetical protein
VVCETDLGICDEIVRVRTVEVEGYEVVGASAGTCGDPRLDRLSVKLF